MSLPWRLVLWVVAPLLIFTTAAALLVLRPLEDRFEQRMQEEVQMVARALQRPVSRALERNSHGSIRDALKSAFEIGRVYSAHVYDAEGAVLASIGESSQALSRDALANRWRQQGAGGYGRAGSKRVYSYFVPVWIDAHGARGLLEVTRLKSDIETFIGRLRLQTALVLAAASSVLILIVFVGYHVAVGGSLSRFHASIERIEQGERKHRAEPHGPKELRVIVSSFNAMLDAIEQSEETLREAREKRLMLQVQLMASEKLAGIGRIAAGIAHELGTPLGAVSARVQRMLRTEGLSARHVTELQKIGAEADRMTRIVTEVLDFAREGKGRRRRISMAALASMAARAVQEEAMVRRVSLLVKGADSERYISADPARFERALVNLLRNAIQASEPGCTVRLGWDVAGELGQFIVDDEGSGIPEAAILHLFQPFFTTRGERGTGLGLAVVEAIVRQHDGSVWAENRAEGGARFLLQVPLAEPVARVVRAS